MPGINVSELIQFRSQLGEAALDPGRWQTLLERLCQTIDAQGASLRQPLLRTADVPYTRSMEHLTNIYFRQGWNETDIRCQYLARRPQKLPAFSEPHVWSSDELNTLFRKHEYFNEFLRLEKLKWGAWIQFRSGGEPWLISIQRTEAQGPFELGDLDLLGSLSQSLTDVANLSSTVGHAVLAGVLDGLHLVQLPALALDRNGLVLGINAGADAVFDSDCRVHNSRLLIRDGKARQTLERLMSNAVGGDDFPRGPNKQVGSIIVARRETKKPILMKLLRVHEAASAPFLGAKFILTLTDLEAGRLSSLATISEAFSLTGAEAKVASMIAAGSSPEEIAGELQVSRETVRNQIKAIFRKTGTHRQSELAVLLSRIQS